MVYNFIVLGFGKYGKGFGFLGFMDGLSTRTMKVQNQYRLSKRGIESKVRKCGTNLLH